MEKEYCPKCFRQLEHIIIKKEDVFGCPKCKKEISRAKSVKLTGWEKIFDFIKINKGGIKWLD